VERLGLPRGEYTEVVPFRRVVFTWGWSSARQTTSKEISGFYIVLARHHLEPGLFSAAF
jgi:uncharacterized protein YndB with AHSA1/START domain